MATLCWSQHGGSGFGFTRADVLEMDMDEIAFYVAWQEKRRSQEAKQVRGGHA